MNKGLTVILGLLALVMAVGAIVTLRDQGASTPAADGTTLGQPLLPQLKAADVARITIRAPQATLTLEKKNQRWVINERDGFPADLDKVTELVVKAIELKTGQTEAIGEKDRARMQLGAPVSATVPASAAAGAAMPAATASASAQGAATALMFAGVDGKILAEFWLGKKYFKTAPEGDPAKAQGDGRYVMLPANPAHVVVVADPLKQASSNAADWIARDGVAVDNIKSLEVILPEGGYRIARALLEAPWELDGTHAKPAKAAKPAAAKAGSPPADPGSSAAAGGLDQSRANNASYALAKLDLEDVATTGGSAAASATASATASTAASTDAEPPKGSEIIASTFDGIGYRIKVGRLDGTRYRVQITVQGDISRSAPSAPPNEKPEDKTKREKAFADQTASLNARIAREKALGPFTLLMAKAKFDEVLKPREAMLTQEKKDAKK